MTMALRQRVFLGLIAVVAFMTAGAQPGLADTSALVSLNPPSQTGLKKQKLDPLDAYFATGPLPRFHIELNPTEMQGLDNDPKTYIRAQIRESAPGEPDRVYRDVGLHLKGGFGSVRPVADKPALTLNFDKFVNGQNFHGLDKLHLNNSVQDLSYMCENIGGWVFRESGVPAPRVSAARVWLNGRDLGIFVLKEGFDAPFYKRYFKDRSGELYDGNFTDVDRNMPIHLGEHKLSPIDPSDSQALRKREIHLDELRNKAWARLRDLSDACIEVDPGKRHQMLDQVLDVDRFFTFLACETMVTHWDGYATNRNNYRIYHDPKTDRLVFLPHGMDQLFQRPEHSLYGNNALVALALTINNDADRKHYLERVAQLRKGAFKTEIITAQLARISARIKPLFEEIGPEALAEHVARTETLRKRIVERCDAIDRQLAKEPKPLQFDATGVATLSNWWPMHQDDGGDALPEKFEEDGKPRLRVACKAPGGTASWRTNELLTSGTYTFSARMKTIGVTPARMIADALGGGGACLRVSGSRHSTRYTGDSEWQTITYTFSVTQPIREVIFICELSAGSGQAIFDPASVKVERRQRLIEP
jgi:spore coat protein H